MDGIKKTKNESPDSSFEEREGCSVCGGPMHEEVFIWVDGLMEYVLLGEVGGPKRECKLTEEDYELIEKYEMENEMEMFLT